MKRYLIPILLCLALASASWAGCGGDGLPAAAELDEYLEVSAAIIERHVETMETTVLGHEELRAAALSGHQSQAIAGLAAYLAILNWALERTDTALDDLGKLTPPPEAEKYHSLTVARVEKEKDGLTDGRSYYASVLRYGSGDEDTLERANQLLSEALQLNLPAESELAVLTQEVGR